jgi:hypothetical protein
MSRIQNFGGAVVPQLTFAPDVHAGPHQYRTVQIHVNHDNACPFKQQDGKPQGSCWLVLNDFGPARHT